MSDDSDKQELRRLFELMLLVRAFASRRMR